MPMLTAMAETVVYQPDYIALGIVAVIGVILVIAVIRKAIANKKAAKAALSAPAEEIVEPVSAPVAPGSAGALKLHTVDPKTAAMLMAIVADKMGKPLNELRFISIKEVE